MTDNISYTAEEVAAILKISRFTVYELIKRGDLRSYRIGRKARIDLEDLEMYKQKAKGVPLAQNNDMELENKNYTNDSLVICGQDIVLDILTRHLEKCMPGTRFLRNHIGSIDGLLALYKGSADIVATHLWDGDSDEYNTPYIRKFLPGHKCVVINLVYRYEGFYVAKDNPKNILSWTDLTRPDVIFVNRERGSGARVLLDETFRKLGIEHEQVCGYNQEEMSHLAIASMVSRGDADVGLGIEKAAMQVPNIEFIPLQRERYDIVIRKQDIEKPIVKSLLSVVNSTSFKKEVSGLGGYDVSLMGRIINEG